MNNLTYKLFQFCHMGYQPHFAAGRSLESKGRAINAPLMEAIGALKNQVWEVSNG